MSQYYEMEDQTLWNPSNGASQLFMRQMDVYRAELGLPCGIGPMRGDACQIDPVVFKEFVDALLAWHRNTSHPVMAALSEGFVAAVLVLAERADIQVNWLPADVAKDGSRTDVQVPAAQVVAEEAWASALRRTSHELGRFMAA
ncbi:DUF6086 family protein [Streptomyces violascens]|uniref:DUF6086 family protein n=1 Tax=Streptomyces violascens TaxID=67381 RepID=UPI00368DF96A